MENILIIIAIVLSIVAIILMHKNEVINKLIRLRMSGLLGIILFAVAIWLNYFY